ncbi:hypothetical protein KHA93_12865 [Bacillus sp. FJAT-49732]|uniref:Uncharacterized protein n=1 Tax=Lederbergia citrisecunda TaxID=2833583 RepID=A0A942YLD0_9BACI|nr:hypothetical protein [Lederbergia citrisecunda]MBS4200522.1 hypothetical protein [Lederbergia citrisecunda]
MFYVAILFQILVFLYFEITTLVNLFPWNDLSKYTVRQKWTEAISNGVILLVCIGLFATKTSWGMGISLLFWVFFFIMQLLTWWMPYVMGQHLKQFPKTLYESHFSRTVKILPPIKNHIVPDAQHNVLQLLSLSAIIFSIAAFWG